MTYSTISWRTVTFTANPGYDKDGDDLEYEWNFGDESELVMGPELTIEHEYPDTYKGDTYNASMHVYDGHIGSYSEWIYQQVVVERPKVDDYTVNVDVNPKATIEMEFLLDVTQVTDEGITSIFKANSIEEIAEKTGLNKDKLTETINEYNHACDVLSHFHRMSKFFSRP